MRLRTLISLSALLLSWQRADAQLAPADDFFHGGAQFYLSNNIPAALERVESGLKIYPDDTKLKKLEELLKQQQQQQNQNQRQQSKQDQQQQQQKSEEQKQREQSQADQQQEQKEEQERQQAKSKSQDGEKSDEQQQAEAQPVVAGQMTEQQAKQLLDAQKGNEHVLIFKPAGEKDKARKKTLKDW